MRTLGDRIKHIREALNLTQEELARMAGVTKQAVQQWEAGETQNLRMGPLFALQRKTKFCAEWIATGNGEARLRDVLAAEGSLVDLSALSPESQAAIREAVRALARQANAPVVNDS